MVWKDVCAGQQQLWALTLWLKTVYSGVPGRTFVFSCFGGVDGSLHQQLPPNVCLSMCVLHRFVTDYIIWRGRPARVSLTPVWRALRRSLCSCVCSAAWGSPAALLRWPVCINRLQRENSCPHGRHLPLCLPPFLCCTSPVLPSPSTHPLFPVFFPCQSGVSDRRTQSHNAIVFSPAAHFDRAVSPGPSEGWFAGWACLCVLLLHCSQLHTAVASALVSHASVGLVHLRSKRCVLLVNKNAAFHPSPWWPFIWVCWYICKHM